MPFSVLAVPEGNSVHDKVRELVNKSHEMERQGDYASSAEMLKQACELDPSSPQLHCIYGGILSLLQQYDLAVTEIRKGLDLDKTQSQAWYVLGTVYGKKGDLKAAADAYGEYLRLHPKGLQARKARTVIDVFRNEGTEDSTDALRAIYLHDHGYAMLKSGDITGAILLFKQACDMEPSVAYFHYDYGVSLVKLGHNDEAMSEFQKAIDFDKKLAEAWRNIGTLYKIKGDYKTAVADYEEYLRLSPAAYDKLLITALIEDLNGRLTQTKSR